MHILLDIFLFNLRQIWSHTHTHTKPEEYFVLKDFISLNTSLVSIGVNKNNTIASFKKNIEIWDILNTESLMWLVSKIFTFVQIILFPYEAVRDPYIYFLERNCYRNNINLIHTAIIPHHHCGTTVRHELGQWHRQAGLGQWQWLFFC